MSFNAIDSTLITSGQRQFSSQKHIYALLIPSKTRLYLKFIRVRDIKLNFETNFCHELSTNATC
jgi:hypothetical protein